MARGYVRVTRDPVGVCTPRSLILSADNDPGDLISSGDALCRLGHEKSYAAGYQRLLRLERAPGGLDVWRTGSNPRARKLYSQRQVERIARLVDARELATIVGNNVGYRVNPAGLLRAAREDKIPSNQIGGSVLFDPDEVLGALRAPGKRDDSKYLPIRPRDGNRTVRCSNPGCVRGPSGSRSPVTVTAYDLEHYATHFCCWACKYEAPELWNRRPRIKLACEALLDDGTPCGHEALLTPGKMRLVDQGKLHPRCDECIARGRRVKRQAHTPETRARIAASKSAYWASHTDLVEVHRAAVKSLAGVRGRSPEQMNRLVGGRMRAHRERRDRIAKMLRSDPTRSNRSISRELHIAPQTVGSVRHKLERAGEIPERRWASRPQKNYPGYMSDCYYTAEMAAVVMRQARARRRRSASDTQNTRQAVEDGIRAGHTNAQIAAAHLISERHVTRVRRELGAPGTSGRPRKKGTSLR